MNDSRYDGEEGMDNIDNTIELLQNTISFSVPLLLKPIYDINAPNSCFLTCLQSGAFDNTTRCMIEMGIPRETALYLLDEVFEGKKFDKEEKIELEIEIRKTIKENYRLLPYWIRIQLDFLV